MKKHIYLNSKGDLEAQDIDPNRDESFYLNLRAGSIIVEESDLPSEDYLEHWEIENGTVVVSQTKGLERFREKKAEEININKQESLYQDIAYLGKMFKNSEKSILNLTAAYSLLEDGETEDWLDVSGSVVNLSKSQFKELMLLIKQHHSSIYFQEAVKYYQLNNSSTINELDAITADFS